MKLFKQPTAQTISAFIMLLAGIGFEHCLVCGAACGGAQRLGNDLYGRGADLCRLGVWHEGVCGTKNWRTQ